MPNWCSTCYRVLDEDNKLFNVLQTAFKNNKHTEVWEGDILKALNIDIPGYIRGFIESYGKEGQYIIIWASEAWERTEFMESLNSIFPEIYFCSVEPGLEYYETNNPEFFGNYIVMITEHNDVYEEYYDTEEDVFDMLEEDYGISNYEELTDSNINREGRLHIEVRKFNVV